MNPAIAVALAASMTADVPGVYRRGSVKKKKLTTAERYSEQIVKAMKPILPAVERGETKIRFTVKVGRHLLQRHMDFSVAVTKEDAQRLAYNHYQVLLKEALELDAQELLKVAQCPKCREWFPTFEERNEHRAAEHSAAAAARRIEDDLTDAKESPDLVAAMVDAFAEVIERPDGTIYWARNSPYKAT